MDEVENTELVDAIDVEDVLEEDKRPPMPQEEELYLDRRSTIATLRERLAAFLIDCIVFFYAYFLIGTVARFVFYKQWEGPLPFYGWQGLAFNGAFLFCCFMYYFLLEGVFFATLGKFFCWMFVRKKDGSYASMSAIFVRNLLRVIDFALPILPFFCMELTKRHQRFGDVLAGTTVVKKHSSESEHFNITGDNIATASGRVLSFLIDLVIVGALFSGWLLLISPEHPGVSKWLLLFSPMVPFIYFAVTEGLTGTTPGKWVFGYTITDEDGNELSFAGSTIRTFLRLFDMNPVGLAALWVSPRKQRFGDLAAETLVSRQPRKWHGAVGLAVWFFISAVVLWSGLQNKNNIFSSEFKFNFLPTVEFMGTFAEESAYKELTLTNIRFAVNNVNTERMPATYLPGETVYIIFDVYGYERSGRMVWLQEDLDVRYPDGSIGLHQENVFDYHQPIRSGAPVEFQNKVELRDNSQGGTYTVTITVRDLFAREKTQLKQTFEVRAPQPVAPPQPLPVPETQLRADMPQAVPAQPVPSLPPPSINVVPPGSSLPPQSPPPPPTTPEGRPAPSF